MREVAAKYKEAGIPWMPSIGHRLHGAVRGLYRVRREIPGSARLAADMKKEGIHLVPIIDAGVKIEDGYSVYEEGKAAGYFCKEEDGTDFVGAVWPGRAHFPDMLNPEARRWFGLKYKFLLDQGIDGFWNDMNEPAIFYSEKRLNKVFDEVASMKGRTWIWTRTITCWAL